MTARLGELAVRFGCELRGDPDVRIERVATLQEASPGSIAFLANPHYRRFLATTRASAVVVDAAAAAACPVAALVTRNPYATYARIAQLLYPEQQFAPGRHASAIVEDAAVVDPGAHVGALAFIAAGATIGPRAVVGPGSVVLEGVRIGADTRLVARVTLCAGVQVGERCLLHPGSVIGADGFGHAPESGAYVKVPQVGSVQLGNDVEVGANTTIDRGAIGDTVIDDGVKIDNLVQVGHNVTLGEHVIVVAQTGISGSTRVERGATLAGQSGIGGHIVIGEGAVVGSQAGVTKSVPPHTQVSGYPAQPHGLAKRIHALTMRLPQMVERLQEIERRLRALEEEKSADHIRSGG